MVAFPMLYAFNRKDCRAWVMQTTRGDEFTTTEMPRFAVLLCEAPRKILELMFRISKQPINLFSHTA